MVLKNYKLLLAMLLSILCTRASAYDFAVQNSDEVTIYYENYGYNSNLGSYVACVTYKSYNSATNCSEGYEGVTTLNIPEKVTYGNVEYTVTTIHSDAFRGCSGLTSVTIPNSVTSIGSCAFYQCTGLTSVTIPNSVTSIDYSAFQNCSGLTSVTTGNSVTTIGNSAFSGCSGLTSVTIGNSVTSISNSAFSGCRGLTSVAIPNSVTSIGNYAFYLCTGLTSVTIGNSVTSIGVEAFYGCSGLTSVTIGNSVTSIGNSAFYLCTGLTSVTIGNSVTSIGESAFYGVGALELEATEPIVLTAQIIGSKSTVIYVPQSALEAYRSAEVWSNRRVNIIAKEAEHAFDVETPVLSTIGPNQFENVVSLKLSGNVSSEDVMYIRNKMYNLQHLDLTDAVFVESTEEYASGRKIHAGKCGGFYSLSNLRSVKLPTSTGTIEEGAFSSCPYLRNVTFPVGIKDIGYYAFSGCSALGSAVLPEGLKTIGYGAFQDCSRLKSVAFPSTLETIDDRAFYCCSQLTSVSLPTSLKSIGLEAFYSCGALKELRIPSSVETIGTEAFYYCSKLKDIYTYTVLPTVINSNTFSTYTTATLHAPKQGYINYYSNAQWGQFPSIVDFDEPYTYFYLNDDLTLDDTTGRIEGEGNNNPDADVNPGGGLIVEGDDDQNLDDLHIHEGDNSGGSVIGDGNIDANNLFIDIEIKKNKWYYFCFPYRIALADIQFSCEASWTFRQYDGEERANNGYGGWKHMPEATEYLTANQGYIFRCSENGTLQIPVAKTEFGKFAGGDREQTMATYTTDKGAEHASWNFIGNPYTCYYDIDDMQNGTNGYTGPIIVWDVATQSYETVRPGDDEYHLRPFEAYFVQKPEGQAKMGYDEDGRHTYQQWDKILLQKQANQNARAKGPRTRHLVNLVLTDGQTTDKTRVVFNEKCAKDYEIGTDAAKFMSSGKPQLYTLDQRQVQYAINERPAGDVPLGYTTTKAGELTISAPRMDKKVCLRDNVTGTTHDLQNGGYTFQTEAGTFNARFTIVADSSTTDIDVTKADEQATPTVYTLDGKQVPEPQKGQVNIIDKKKVIK